MKNELLKWYRTNKRDLPWRLNRDAYRIWISEVMLQQTTVATVIPFYQRFMKRFPDIKTLAHSSEQDVIEMWAGLGYYSRARNIHKAAQIIFKNGFPQHSLELLKLPGFGPYTANAVASLAFNEKVGVLDGNVIRVLSRLYGLKSKWWHPKERAHLQNLSTELAQTENNSEINQGLMELGATICTPKKPLCWLCPWKNKCVAFEKNWVEKLPLSKPKQATEIWYWQFEIEKNDSHIYLEANNSTPFLTQLYFPKSQAKKLTKKPKLYDIKHSVTKYEIYIKLKTKLSHKKPKSNWFELKSIKKHNPSSLMTKILKKIN